MSKKIYILLTDTGTLFTKSIKAYTKAPYNHASIALDLELNELYSFGRKKASNPFYGGFVKEDVLGGTYSKYPETECAIYEMEITDRQLEKVKRLLHLFKRNEKKLYYNLLGVLGVSIKEPIEVNSSYFCSQFVSDLLNRSGIKLWDKLPSLVTPDDFRKSNKLQLIYEGKLYEYSPIKNRKNN